MLPRHRQHDAKDGLAVVPWFWRDWRASTARAYFLSTKNYLAGWCYRELLDAHWGEADCALRPDDQDLAALAGVSLEEWRSVRDVVLRWLLFTESGKVQSARALFEWKRSKKARAATRKRASEAAKRRWDNEKGATKAASLSNAWSNAQALPKHSSSNAWAMLEECPPTPSPSPSPSPIRTTATTPLTPRKRGASTSGPAPREEPTGNGHRPGPRDELRDAALKLRHQVEQARAFAVDQKLEPTRADLRAFRSWFRGGATLATVQTRIERGDHLARRTPDGGVYRPEVRPPDHLGAEELDLLDLPLPSEDAQPPPGDDE